MSPRLPPAAEAVLAGDRRALARLISQVEDRDPAADAALRALYGRSGRARIVGLTGPLGVGKSSLINALLRHLRKQGRSVGIVAVDPSSPFSGGSVLGDRIRLERDPGDAGVFVRSMASRGHSGGVAEATREVARLLDAFGMDVVLVETVGSGQVDVEIREIASTSIVVLVPHLGDEVQSLKAGLFEIADVFCVNKADLPGADGAARDLTDLVATGAGHDGWRASVIATSTATSTGIEELWAAVEAHEAFLDQDGRRATADRERSRSELMGLVRERVDRELAEALADEQDVGGLLDDLIARRLDPRTAADRLFEQLPTPVSTGPVMSVPIPLILILALLILILYFVFASFAYGAGYQPTPRPIVERMLELAEVGPADLVYDLGAGTGAIVFRAARERGARVLGIEVEPLRILILRLRRRLGPGADRIRLSWGNLFDLDYRSATVVTAFLWPDAMRRLRPILEAQLPGGSRVVSYYHPVPGWTPARVDEELRVYLYRR